MNSPTSEAFKAITQVSKQLRQEWTVWGAVCQDPDLYKNPTDNFREFGEGKGSRRLWVLESNSRCSVGLWLWSETVRFQA